jgi:hypothetical protein
MIKKHESNKDALNRNDELINDYLQDVFGEVSENRLTETVPLCTFFEGASSDETPIHQANIIAESIQPSCFLVPTIKLLSSNSGNEGYSQPQAILILLTVLYFLRRPLSPRVRQCFLNLSEQVIDDYQFASFKYQMTRQGIFA